MLRSVPMPAALMSDEPEFASELDAALESARDLPEAATRWEVTDHRRAEWAMRKLAALDARDREVRAQARDWRAEIDAWEADEHGRIDRAMEHFNGLLERYGVAWRLANPKEATIRLPSGEIATTMPKTPQVSVDDETVVIEWARAALPKERFAEVVRTTEKVLVSELRGGLDVQKRLVPACTECGAMLLPCDGDGWAHPSGEGELGEPYEFDHEPAPGSMWEVLFDGDPVPGVSAALGEVRAIVKPAR